MEKLSSASALIAKSRPERPVRGLRPHAAGRAARWFLDKFPGDVAYAYKANSSVFLVGALYGAGIRHFDVASLPEIEDAATIPDAHLHFMHPGQVAPRHPPRLRARRALIRPRRRGRARQDARRRPATRAISCSGCVSRCRPSTAASRSSASSASPARRRRSLLVKTRQAAAELGLTFHVGSQTTTPDAFVTALAEVHR